MQGQESLEDLRVDLIVSGEPVTFPDIFEPKAKDFTDPFWIHAFGN